MKRFFAVLAIVAVAGIHASTADADSHVHGHKQLNHPSRLGNGYHPVHKTRTGHNVHAHVNGGKVHGLHVKDRNGRQVAVQRKVNRARARVSLDGQPDLSQIAQAGTENIFAAGDSVQEVALQGPIYVYICFGFYDAFDNVWVWIWFPSSWVIGGGPDVEGTGF